MTFDPCVGVTFGGVLFTFILSEIDKLQQTSNGSWTHNFILSPSPFLSEKEKRGVGGRGAVWDFNLCFPDVITRAALLSVGELLWWRIYLWHWGLLEVRPGLICGNAARLILFELWLILHIGTISFRVLIEGSGKTWKQDQRIRFHHVDTGGYLHSHDKKYTRIAGGQQEVRKKKPSLYFFSN